MNSGVASCACQLHSNLLFLGSWLANSLLVHVTNPQVRPPVSDTSCVNSTQTHRYLFETVLALHKLLTHPQALHTCLNPSYLHNLSRLADCVVRRAVSACACGPDYNLCNPNKPAGRSTSCFDPAQVGEMWHMLCYALLRHVTHVARGLKVA